MEKYQGAGCGRVEPGEPDLAGRTGGGRNCPGEHCQAERDRKVTGSDWCGLRKSKWCLNPLHVIGVEVRSFVEEEEAMGGDHLEALVKPLLLCPLHAPRRADQAGAVSVGRLNLHLCSALLRAELQCSVQLCGHSHGRTQACWSGCRE